MKVTHVKTRIISTPADNPLVVGIPVGNATREFVTLELGTDAGVEGLGLTFFGGPLTVALRDAVESIASGIFDKGPVVKGQVVRIFTKHVRTDPRLNETTAGPPGARPLQIITETSLHRS